MGAPRLQESGTEEEDEGGGAGCREGATLFLPTLIHGVSR